MKNLKNKLKKVTRFFVWVEKKKTKKHEQNKHEILVFMYSGVFFFLPSITCLRYVKTQINIKNKTLKLETFSFFAN